MHILLSSRKKQLYKNYASLLRQISFSVMFQLSLNVIKKPGQLTSNLKTTQTNLFAYYILLNNMLKSPVTWFPESRGKT